MNWLQLFGWNIIISNTYIKFCRQTYFVSTAEDNVARKKFSTGLNYPIRHENNNAVTFVIHHMWNQAKTPLKMTRKDDIHWSFHAYIFRTLTYTHIEIHKRFSYTNLLWETNKEVRKIRVLTCTPIIIN